MRRGPFVAALAGAATVGAPAVLRAQTATQLTVMTLPIDQGAQAFYAEDLGMFKRAGLDAQVSIAKFGTEVAAAVAGGSIQIGQSNIMSLAIAHEHGLPFALIAGAGQYSSAKPTSYMLVLKSSPLKTAKDLSGKTVAVNGLKSITQISVQDWTDKNGGDSTQIKFVEMPFTEMEPALASARIDAALMADPDATTALALGHTRVFSIPFDAIGRDWLIGGWFAKTDWIAANRATVQAFIATMRDSARWGNTPANYPQSAAILQKYTKVAVGSANRIKYAERLEAPQVQPQIDVAAHYKLLAASFPASAMIADGV